MLYLTLPHLASPCLTSPQVAVLTYRASDSKKQTYRSRSMNNSDDEVAFSADVVTELRSLGEFFRCWSLVGPVAAR